MAEIVLEAVSKVFSGKVVALNSVTLNVRDGEFLVLVGPSGCGKSTLLRLIAGLEEPTTGRIFIGGREVTDVPAKRRDIAMVFQNYALYPHMSVERNLSFGLRLRKTAKPEVRARVDDVARILGLEDLLGRKPAQLSGGQRQRVAMGRAMVREPQAFLMDEPLSNLDAKLRVSMRSELARLHERLRTTTVYVTHDQVEAMTLGHRVVVMHDGVIQQIDTPNALFNRPANLYVAGFIGSPSMNFARARVERQQLTFGQFRVALSKSSWLNILEGRDFILGIRPNTFEDHAFAESNLPRIEIRPEIVEELGTDAMVVFPVDGAVVDDVQKFAEGPEEAEARLVHDESLTFTARVDPRTQIRSGENARVALDPERFHAFDPSTGEAIDHAGRVPTTSSKSRAAIA